MTPDPWRPGLVAALDHLRPSLAAIFGEPSRRQKEVPAREHLVELGVAVAERLVAEIAAVGPEAVERHEDRPPRGKNLMDPSGLAYGSFGPLTPARPRG